jgi:hypothetical protein
MTDQPLWTETVPSATKSARPFSQADSEGIIFTRFMVDRVRCIAWSSACRNRDSVRRRVTDQACLLDFRGVRLKNDLKQHRTPPKRSSPKSTSRTLEHPYLRYASPFFIISFCASLVESRHMKSAVCRSIRYLLLLLRFAHSRSRSENYFFLGVGKPQASISFHLVSRTMRPYQKIKYLVKQTGSPPACH